MTFRVGFGYDVHRLETGRKFMLGGVEVPFGKGAVGHSDADVLLHAIMDAMLGAACLGDIGQHFPDTDSRYKGVSSLKLLTEVKKVIENEGYSVGNIDSTVCLEEPKISKYASEMKNRLAAALNIPENCISIKATTNEGLGFVGRGEGVSAYAVVLLNGD